MTVAAVSETNVLAGLRDRVTAWPRARRRLAALLCGVLAAFALPPWQIFPLLVPSLVCLVWLLDAAPTRRAAFATGFWFGFGLFAVAFHWIAAPMLVEPARTGWLIPFAIVGLAAALAMFVAVTTVAYHFATRRGWVVGVGRVIALAVIWTFVEWLRGWLFTGFPWNLMGHVWSASPAMLQATAITGIFGLTLLTVAAAAMPALLADTRRALVPVIVFTLLLPGAVWAAGAWRLAAAPLDTLATFPDVRLRIVQANIVQRDKWRPELRADNLRAHVDLSNQPAAGLPPTHVVWPETAVPFFLDSSPEAREFAALAAPDNGFLITGAPRRRADGDGAATFWNSVHAISADAAVVATYDKAHLVPFGEYVPARGILPIDRIVPGQGDFTPGPGPRTLRLPGLPAVSPLVCYEAIFPGQVTDPGDRPEWLLNVTNDAWFGRFAGPRQHLAMARVRSVEEGLAMVRAAGTGISAVVDPYGRLFRYLPLGQRGVLDTPLPTPLPPTVFARFGNNVLFVLLALGTLLALVSRIARPQESR